MTQIWHNPRCSKSRQTLALLQEEGQAPEIRKYLETPPTADEIIEALAQLDIPAIAMMRTSEKQFKDLGLTKMTPEDTLVAAMTKHPILIERPIVFHAGKAAIGRPPEAVLSLFN